MTTLAPAAEAARPSMPLKLFYGFGSVAYGVKDQGFSALLLLFYNQVVGLPAQEVGLAIMVALVLDAFIDPVIGQSSDSTRTRLGRRHPFMYAAILPVALSYGFLWAPPAGWSEPALFAYLVCGAIIVRTFIAFYEIPSAALAPELTTDYDQRTALMGWRYFFGWCGGLLMTLAAFYIFLKPGPGYPVGQLNPAGYRTYGLAAAVVIASAIIISALGTQRRVMRLPSTPLPPRRPLGQTLREMRSTLTHHSFVMVALAGLCIAMAFGVTLALNVYFSTYFWELDTNQIGLLVLAPFLSAGLALTLATPFGKRFGKKPAAIGLTVLTVGVSLSPFVLRLLGLFPGNDDPVLLPLLFGIIVVATAMSIAKNILIASMIADVVEDSARRTGRRSEGLFFAANSFIQKAVSGAGAFVSGLILTAVAFPAGAKPGEVPDAVLRDLALHYLPTLAALYALACVFLLFYRIDRASHEANVSALAAAGPPEVAETAPA